MSFPRGWMGLTAFSSLALSLTIMTTFADPPKSEKKKALSEVWLTLRDLPEDTELSEKDYERELLALRKLGDEATGKDEFDPDNIGKLLPFLMSQDWRLRARGLTILINVSRPHVTEYEEYIIPLIVDPNKAVRFGASKLILLHGSRETRAVLGNLDKSKNERYRKMADEAIKKSTLTRK